MEGMVLSWKLLRLMESFVSKMEIEHFLKKSVNCGKFVSPMQILVYLRLFMKNTSQVGTNAGT
jgi:hypothetical protein